MSVAPATMTELDPATAIVLASLRQQADALVPVCARLDHALDRVPRSAHGTWRGPAGAAYDEGLRQLTRLAQAARSATHDALDATRTAVAVLAGSAS